MWKDNIKNNLREKEWHDMDRIELTQEGPMDDSCEYGNEASVFIKCWEILE
jgi:hypothetical protein